MGTLQARQVNRFLRIASLPDGRILRDAIFAPGSVILKAFQGTRKRGRPRLEWSTVVYALVSKAGG